MPLPVLKIAPASDEAIAVLRAQPELFSRALMPAVNSAATRLASRIAQTQFRGSPLQTRTGILAGSVASRVFRVGDVVLAQIGTIKGPARAYARIQEEGGVIKPVKGKALAVPLAGAKTPSGRPRFPGGPREAQAKYPDMFLLKRRGKPPLLVRPLRVRGRSNGRVKALIPMFILLKRVTIKATRWLSEGVSRNVDVWDVAFTEEMNRRLGGT